MKRIAPLAAFALMATSLASAQTAFTQYASPDGAFTVLFPGTPTVSSLETHARSDGTSYTERRYAVEDDAGYLVDIADYPSSGSIPTVENGAAAEASGCGGTYTIKNRDNYQGHPGALIAVNCPAKAGQGGLMVLEQFVSNGSRIYMVAYGGAAIDPSRSSTFLNSLHIN